MSNVNTNKQNNFEDKVSELLDNIQNLQQIELELSTQLNNVGLLEESKTKILNKINELTQLRINLYSIINNLYGYYNNKLNESSNLLDKQIIALNITEQNLNDTKEKLNEMEKEKANKLKLIKINTYYSKKYNAQKSIIQVIIVVLVIIIIISILEMKILLPYTFSKILMSVTIILGLYLIIKQVFDLSYRNNMNFDEYNWYFNKDNAPKIYNSLDEFKKENDTTDPWKIPECVGKEECCNPKTTNIEPMSNLIGPQRFKTYSNY
jgi:hypothetical protein